MQVLRDTWRESGELCELRHDLLGRALGGLPQPYEHAPQHIDGTRYADWTEGERVLDDLIHECQRSLEAIRDAKLYWENRPQAPARGYGRT